jgi:hypothetical protein
MTNNILQSIFHKKGGNLKLTYSAICLTDVENIKKRLAVIYS